MDPNIKTKRLILHPVTLDDVDAIQQCILDPRVYEMVARIPANQPRKATEDWISTHAAGRASTTDYVYAITVNNKFIGLMGLHRGTTSDLFEIGYWMSPKAWGKGYTTEAGKALLLNLETTLGAERTLSGYFADNPTSGRVLEKLGYSKIGENQVHCTGRNKMLPHIIVERVATP